MIQPRPGQLVRWSERNYTAYGVVLETERYVSAVADSTARCTHVSNSKLEVFEDQRHPLKGEQVLIGGEWVQL